jgi:hypothetical protein
MSIKCRRVCVRISYPEVLRREWGEGFNTSLYALQKRTDFGGSCVLYVLGEVGYLTVIRVAINLVVQTLSNARSISRNKDTVALLLEPRIMRSLFLNNSCVVKRLLLKPYSSFLINFSS